MPLDVEHVGLAGAICVYYLERPEPTLVDPGPSTTLDRLTEALSELDVKPGDLRHLLLTHVHLDHAGAAGHLAAANPALSIHIHEEGALHLADPARLVASTRRTFGEAHDRLWGEVLPVPVGSLRGWRPGDPRPLPGLRPLSTPGHIGHHLAWEAERQGVLFSGDSLGIVLHPEGPSHPATPPPAVDLPAWRETLTHTLAPVQVDAFGATHFGLHVGLHRRRQGLMDALRALVVRVDEAMKKGPAAEEADRDAFHREAVEGHVPPLSRERAEHYFSTFPATGDWDGMRFHLSRASDARARFLGEMEPS